MEKPTDRPKYRAYYMIVLTICCGDVRPVSRIQKRLPASTFGMLLLFLSVFADAILFHSQILIVVEKNYNIYKEGDREFHMPGITCVK